MFHYFIHIIGLSCVESINLIFSPIEVVTTRSATRMKLIKSVFVMDYRLN